MSLDCEKETNGGVHCWKSPPYDCEKCGFNPSVAERRLTKIRRERQIKMRAMKKMLCDHCHCEIELGDWFGVWDDETMCTDCLETAVDNQLEAMGTIEKLKMLSGVLKYSVWVRGEI